MDNVVKHGDIFVLHIFKYISSFSYIDNNGIKSNIDGINSS